MLYLVDNIDEDWSTMLIVESKNRFVLGGQMTGDTVEPYQDMCVDVPSIVEPVQFEDDIEWSRDNIDVEEIDLEVQLDIMFNLDPIADDREEVETDDDDKIELDVSLADDSESEEEDDLTGEDTELEEGTDNGICPD